MWTFKMFVSVIRNANPMYLATTTNRVTDSRILKQGGANFYPKVKQILS